jgi:excinuclease ABC subunit C
MIFGDREAFDLSRDQALVGLAERLDLPGAPRRIEAYDISHFQGTDNVASMVVFTDGAANREEYRRFKMRIGGNDDFAHMREVMQRRFSPKNLEAWAKPDLIVIDGGKGQLGAALGVLDELGINVPTIGLAKREEEIIRRSMQASAGPATAATPPSSVANGDLAGDGVPASGVIRNPGHWDNEAWVTANVDWQTILLPPSSHVLQLLQRVRDEAHRFAVTYQAILRGKRQVSSQLDDIPGVGPATRKKLIRAFGSVRGLRQASASEIAAVVGPAKAQTVVENLAAAAPVAVGAADDMAETDQ